jgi:DNA-binding NtrC family response regulator
MRAPENILVIHNDRQRCQMILDAVSHLGHAPSCAHSLSEGLRKITSGAFALVFLEARLPDGSGVEGITKIKVNELSPEIVITTTQGSPDEAEQAIANGAWDYIAAPISPELIQLHIDQILDYRTEKGHRGSSLSLDRKEIIGNSKPLAASLNLLAQAAQSDVNVILTGETGTGKELFARAIHANSRRRQGNFVVVDCTALPETLVESILFGHARGSFTGAYVSQDGLLKQADKGTLFLDEIGELPLAMQKSFLRVIQEHRFRPVGCGR